jgi:hypothetical protein
MKIYRVPGSEGLQHSPASTHGLPLPYLHSLRVAGGKVNYWEVIVSVILSKKVCMYMFPVRKSFRDRAISLYISKIVDKKEILRTVSNTGIYCSSDTVGTVYLV